MEPSFNLEIFAPDRTEVYLSCAGWTPLVSALVKTLDGARVRVVGDVTGLAADSQRVRRIMSNCSGVVAVMPFRERESCTTDPLLVAELRIAAELGMPAAIFIEENVVLRVTRSEGRAALRFGDSDELTMQAGALHGPATCRETLDQPPEGILEPFLADSLRAAGRIRPFAFYIGRLERDFTQAREAIRTAVENEAGMPFLWADDGRHRTNVEGVRERTRLLLKHARFVIADLTLGVESPDHENPSRAHEIGLAIAYDRKLLLLSQEPRRYPYFSVSDLQVVFWETEADLEQKVSEWIRNYRDCLGRTTWNYRLAQEGHRPNIAPARFRYDPKARYIGPKTPRRRRAARKVVLLCAAALCGLVTLLILFGNSEVTWPVR
jgi:hypothetical protein